jgi:hypothetical protein
MAVSLMGVMHVARSASATAHSYYGWATTNCPCDERQSPTCREGRAEEGPVTDPAESALWQPRDGPRLMFLARLFLARRGAASKAPYGRSTRGLPLFVDVIKNSPLR